MERLKKSINDLESMSEEELKELDDESEYDEEELRNLIYSEQNKQTELKKISDKINSRRSFFSRKFTADLKISLTNK